MEMPSKQLIINYVDLLYVTTSMSNKRLKMSLKNKSNKVIKVFIIIMQIYWQSNCLKRGEYFSYFS